MGKVVEVLPFPTSSHKGVEIYDTHDKADGRLGGLVVLKREGYPDLIISVEIGSEVEEAKRKIDETLANG